MARNKKATMLKKSETAPKVSFKKSPTVNLDLNFSLNSSKMSRKVMRIRTASRTARNRDTSISFQSKTPLVKRPRKTPGRLWYQKESFSIKEHGYYGLLKKFKGKKKNLIKIKQGFDNDFKAIYEKKQMMVLPGKRKSKIMKMRPQTAVAKGFNSKRFFNSSGVLSSKIEKKLKGKQTDEANDLYQPVLDNLSFESKEMTYKFLANDFKDQVKKSPQNTTHGTTDVTREMTPLKKFKIGNSKMFSLTQNSDSVPAKHLKLNARKYNEWQNRRSLEESVVPRAQSSYLERGKRKLAQGINTSVYIFDQPKVKINSNTIDKMQKKKEAKKKKLQVNIKKRDKLSQKILRQKSMKLRMLKQGNMLRRRIYMDNFIKKGKFWDPKKFKEEKIKDRKRKRSLDPAIIARKKRLAQRERKRKADLKKLGLIEQERIMKKRLPRHFYRRYFPP